MPSSADKCQKPYSVKKKPETRVYTTLFHALKIPEQVKLIYSDKKQWLPGASGGGSECKGHGSILKGDKNVLFLDCG